MANPISYNNIVSRCYSPIEGNTLQRGTERTSSGGRLAGTMRIVHSTGNCDDDIALMRDADTEAEALRNNIPFYTREDILRLHSHSYFH